LEHPNNKWWRCKLWSSLLYNFLHFLVTSSPLGPNILLSTLSETTLIYIPHFMWETKFHTHTNQQLNFCFV
jgi:hypothetical protein